MKQVIEFFIIAALTISFVLAGFIVGVAIFQYTGTDLVRDLTTAGVILGILLLFIIEASTP